jgi:GalNAc-alpha-(1->4)-GalNAc-alpha-(1->3)-diNAcBac-PP-undecaprenol alpha-1,4-N-acetyl-D-galactosaminyltransferase
MRLTLVISSLQCGGAERVMTIIANYWAAKDWDITLLTLDDGSMPPFYDLAPRIRHVPLAVAGPTASIFEAVTQNLRRIFTLRKAIRHSAPDAVISFIDKTNVSVVFATRGLDLPVIVSEHSHPTIKPLGRIWKQLRRWSYLKADTIVVLSTDDRQFFSARVQKHMAVIPNPVLRPPDSPGHEHQYGRRPLLVGMGRLVREKGFDLLLEAFAGLKEKYPEWSLLILGEGPLRPELTDRTARLGLADRVIMPGRVKNPHAVLKQADLFVLSSRFEAFPMALCEAMASGLPVISTDCASGIRNIIRNDVDGILIAKEDVRDLIRGLDRLMGDWAERRQLAARAPEVCARFSLEQVMELWEQTLDAARLTRQI